MNIINLELVRIPKVDDPLQLTKNLETK